MREARAHEVGEHLDVVVVAQPVLHVPQELEHVEAVQARAQQRVHALERRLAQVQPVVHRVLERAHLDFSDQLFLFQYEYH